MPDPTDKPIPQQPINGQPSGLTPPKKRSKCVILTWVIGVIIAVVLGVTAGGFAWYNFQLTPVGDDANVLKQITIAKNSTSSQIGNELKKELIIRSTTAFDFYIRFSGKANSLQAGTYRLSPGETIPQIVDHLIKGSTDQFSLTFYPGATLVDYVSKTKHDDVTTVLKNAGYSDIEISKGLSTIYDSPLFASKPAGTDLEGYVYGQTYNYNTGATVEDVLKRTFDQFYSDVQDNNLVKAFASHGLTLYQGITLASIVQREIYSPADKSQPTNDQKQAAEVFYNRLKLDMPLGSDVTYQYIADKTGMVRDPNLDSPYNTRRFAGLPPGPISAPDLSALLAVANPASGDYLFFLSGDDNVTYFSKTLTEHEANIANHCKVKCSTP